MYNNVYGLSGTTRTFFSCNDDLCISLALGKIKAGVVPHPLPKKNSTLPSHTNTHINSVTGSGVYMTHTHTHTHTHNAHAHTHTCMHLYVSVCGRSEHLEVVFPEKCAWVMCVCVCVCVCLCVYVC